MKRAFNGVENVDEKRSYAEDAIYSTEIRWKFTYENIIDTIDTILSLIDEDNRNEVLAYLITLVSRDGGLNQSPNSLLIDMTYDVIEEVLEKDTGKNYFIVDGYAAAKRRFLEETVTFGGVNKTLKEKLREMIGGVFETRSDLKVKIEELYTKAENVRGEVTAENTRREEKTIFVFENALNYCTNSQWILELYSKLMGFLTENFWNYVDIAKFIGQPVRNPLPTWTGAKRFTVRQPYRVSKTDKGDLSGVSELLYLNCYKGIRKWYEKDEVFVKPLMRMFCCDDSNGDFLFGVNPYQLPDDFETGNAQTWTVADVYPANKVIYMLFFLSVVSGLYTGSQEEYKAMITSYMVYVHLFNSFCGMRMNSGWNGKISNTYVYINQKIGSYFDPPSMELLQAKLRSGELNFIVEHCKSIEMTEQEAKELVERIKKCNSDWTAEEDSLIFEHVRKNGPYNFSKLEPLIGKKYRQIRERWLTHLYKEVSNNPWSNDEDEILIRKQRECGTNWGLIAFSLPGRSDICC